jgi:hypothetical protein
VDYVIVILVSSVAAGLTLFSGFGLGTVLTPAFALFFPLPVAIAATAVVHLANNLFKLALVGRHADRQTVIRFGVPAALLAILGAGCLLFLNTAPPLTTYALGGRTHEVTLAKIVIGAVIAAFALGELSPRIARLAFDRRFLALGGALSGFFGGLSGHQGALRSAFLIKSGLSKETFVATGVVCAVIVDATRIPIYFARFAESRLASPDSQALGLIVAASLAAFAGSYLGARLLKKMTLRAVQLIVAWGLVMIAVAMAAGLV